MTDPDHGDHLAALFRAAAADPPPSAFDHDRVVATSRRITRRRRSAVVGGAMALLVVAGVGVAVALPRAAGVDAATAAAPAPDAAEESAPGRVVPEQVGPEPAGPEQAGPEPPAADALAAPAEVPDALRDAETSTLAPLGSGTAACADRQDPQLRALVEQVLPEVAGAPEAGVTMECRPPGERGVNLEVDDAGTPGLLTVLYLPPGVAPDAAYEGASAATASGGTVVVSSRPGGPTGTVPFEGRLDTAAAFLAPRL